MPEGGAIRGAAEVPSAAFRPSVRRRFAVTVVTNLLRGVLSFGGGLLIARWLGPSSFGDMTFLLGTFVSLRSLLDMGSSTAFFTFLSQQPRSRRFVRRYYLWMAVQFAIPAFVIGQFLPHDWMASIWRGHARDMILLAFGAAFLQNSLWPAVQQAGESQRRTALVQGAGVVVVAVHVLVVALLWLNGALNVASIFGFTIAEYAIASWVVQRMLFASLTIEADPSDDSFSILVRRYAAYCLPFLPYTLVAFVQEFGDRWLLQRFGGGVQQAYYAIGAQFGAVALLATSSIVRVLWQEVAEAHARGDHEHAAALYKRVSRTLFMLGATIAGFLIPWSAVILRHLLGEPYVAGAGTLAIMLLYPIHQSMGQIGNTVLYATERVSLQAFTGVAMMLVGLVVSYFVLATRDAVVPGFGLQSSGLAIKMVLVQIVWVNIVAYLISRMWRTRFDWLYQPTSIAVCLSAGYLAHFVATRPLGIVVAVPVQLSIALLIHSASVVVLVYLLPWMAGFTRDELKRDVGHVISYMGRALRAKGSLVSH